MARTGHPRGVLNDDTSGHELLGSSNRRCNFPRGCRCGYRRGYRQTREIRCTVKHRRSCDLSPVSSRFFRTPSRNTATEPPRRISYCSQIGQRIAHFTARRLPSRNDRAPKVTSCCRFIFTRSLMRKAWLGIFMVVHFGSLLSATIYERWGHPVRRSGPILTGK